MRQFVHDKNEHGMGTIRVSGNAPTIDKIQFLPLSALNKQLSEPTVIKVSSDSLLMCYVVYSGDFAVDTGEQGVDIVYKHAMQVFDAHTGNLLMQRAYDRK